MSKIVFPIAFLLVAIILILTGCSHQPISSPTLTPSPSMTPTIRPTKTPTPTPTQTLTPIPPTSTPTRTLTPTSTPEPTPYGQSQGFIFTLAREVYPEEYAGLRGSENVFTISIDGSNLTSITNCERGCFLFGKVSPDGKYVFLISQSKDKKNELSILSIDGSSCLKITDQLTSHIGSTASFENAPLWLDDGRIAYLRGTTIVVSDRKGKNSVKLTKPTDYAESLLFADGDKIYWRSAVRNNIGWTTLGFFWTSVNDGETQPVTEWDNYHDKSVNKDILEALFSPANRKVLFRLWNNGSYNWVLADLNGENSIPIFFNGNGAFWSPDGKFILFSNGRRNILYDVAAAKNIDLPSTQAWMPEWSPDGKLIVYYDYDDPWELIDIENKTVKLFDFTTDWKNQRFFNGANWIPATP